MAWGPLGQSAPASEPPCPPPPCSGPGVSGHAERNPAAIAAAAAKTAKEMDRSMQITTLELPSRRRHSALEMRLAAPRHTQPGAHHPRPEGPRERRAFDPPP